MKKKFYIPLLLALSALLNSCSDIADSDADIYAERINYKYIISDQENNVIMPLKVGNKWIYRVSEYDSSGRFVISYDYPILVADEITIDDEKWFKISNPVFNSIADGRFLYKDCGSQLITNTDAGLWLKGFTYPIAHYPIQRATVGTYKNDSIIVLQFDEKKPDSLKEVTLFYKNTISVERHANTDQKMQNNDTIIYKHSVEFVRPYYIKCNPFRIDYFVVNKGLIRSEIYSLSSQVYLQRKYELMNGYDTNNIYIKQLLYDYDCGEIKPGERKTCDLEVLKNINANATIEIPNVSHTGNNIESVLYYTNPLRPNRTFSISIIFNPKLSGQNTDVITIFTNKGNFQLFVKYKVL